MLNIVCHLPISKGLYNAVLEAVSININTFQFFTKNPGDARALETPNDILGRGEEIKLLRGNYK